MWHIPKPTTLGEKSACDTSFHVRKGSFGYSADFMSTIGLLILIYMIY